MTVRAKAFTVLAVLVFTELAILGGREILGALYEPTIRALTS